MVKWSTNAAIAKSAIGDKGADTDTAIRVMEECLRTGQPMFLYLFDRLEGHGEVMSLFDRAIAKLAVRRLIERFGRRALKRHSPPVVVTFPVWGSSGWSNPPPSGAVGISRVVKVPAPTFSLWTSQEEKIDMDAISDDLKRRLHVASYNEGDHVRLDSYQPVSLGSVLKIGDIEIKMAGLGTGGDIYVDVKLPVSPDQVI